MPSYQFSLGIIIFYFSGGYKCKRVPIKTLEKQGFHLKCETGKVDGGTEGKTRSEEGGEKDVATVPGSAKTFVRTVPCACSTS